MMKTIALVVLLAAAVSSAPTYRFLHSRPTGNNVKVQTVPEFRRYAYTSAYASGSGSSYASTTMAPTPAPSTTGTRIYASLTLVGVTPDQFTTVVRTAFKGAVAAGVTTAQAAGVDITSPAARRDFSVAFSMDTGITGTTAVNAAQSTLMAHLQDTGSNGFLSKLQAAVAAAGASFPVTGVTGVSVSSCPGGCGSNSSSGLSAGAIAGIVIGCVVGVAIIAGLIYYLAFANKSHQPTNATITKGPDNNETINNQWGASDNERVIDDKTVSI